MAEKKAGYRNPPVKSRFLPGVSGNPKGRPRRKPSNLEELGAWILSRAITYTEKGRKRSMSRSDFLIKAMVEKAASGDIAAAADVLYALTRCQRDGAAGASRVEVKDWLPEPGLQGAPLSEQES